jgi:hypothetical protein
MRRVHRTSAACDTEEWWRKFSATFATAQRRCHNSARLSEQPDGLEKNGLKVLSKNRGTAEEMAANFYSMANHSAPAMFTNRRDRADRTFKAVELVPRTRYDQLECLVVLITAYFVFRHLPPHFAR